MHSVGAYCGKSARWVLSGETRHKKPCRLGEGTGAKAPDTARLRQGYRFEARLYLPAVRD
jgi:hypothetical protein